MISEKSSNSSQFQSVVDLTETKITPFHLSIKGNPLSSFLTEKYLYLVSENQIQRLNYGFPAQSTQNISFTNLKVFSLCKYEHFPNTEFTCWCVCDNTLYGLNKAKRYVLQYDGEFATVVYANPDREINNITCSKNGNIYVSSKNAVFEIENPRDEKLYRSGYEEQTKLEENLKIVEGKFSWDNLPKNYTIEKFKVKAKLSTFFFGICSDENKPDEDNFLIYDLVYGKVKFYPYKSNEITDFDASLMLNYCTIVKNFASIQIYSFDNANPQEMTILKQLDTFKANITRISLGNFEGNQNLVIGHKDGTLSSYNIITKEFGLEDSRISNSEVIFIHRINDYESIIGPETKISEKINIFKRDQFVVTCKDSYVAIFADKYTAKTFGILLHNGMARNLSVSKDSNLIAVVGEDKKLNVLSYKCKTLQYTIDDFHDAEIYCVEFSKDNKTIATTSADKIIKIFDVKSKKLKVRISDSHKMEVTTCKFSPNGKIQLTASKKGDISLWNIKNKKMIFNKKIWPGVIIFTCDYSPCGKFLLAGCNNGSINIVNMVTRRVSLEFPGTHTNFVNSVCFSPNGKMIASASSDCTVKLYDVTCNIGFELKHWNDQFTRWVRTCEFSKDSSRLAAGCYNNTIKIFSTKAGYECLNFIENASFCWVMNLAFSEDGKYLFSSGRDGHLNIFEVDTTVCLHKIKQNTGKIISKVAFQSLNDEPTGEEENPDAIENEQASQNYSIFVAYSNSGLATRYFHNGLYDVKSKLHNDGVTDFKILTEYKCLVSTGQDRKLNINSYRQGQILNRISRNDNVGPSILRCLCVNNGNPEQFVGGGEDGSMHFYRFNVQNPLLTFHFHHNGRVTAIIKFESYYISTGEDGVLALHNAHGHVNKLMPLFETEIFDCQYHKKLGIVAASTYQYIKIVNVSDLNAADSFANLKVMSQIETNQGNIRSLSFSNTNSEGVVLVTAGDTYDIKLWKIEKNEIEKPKKKLQKILKYFTKYENTYKEIFVEFAGTILENVLNEQITSLSFNQVSDQEQLVVGTERDQIYLVDLKFT